MAGTTSTTRRIFVRTGALHITSMPRTIRSTRVGNNEDFFIAMFRLLLLLYDSILNTVRKTRTGYLDPLFLQQISQARTVRAFRRAEVRIVGRSSVRP